MDNSLIRLVLPAPCHEASYHAMMAEWESFGGLLNPGALRLRGRSYAEWLADISLCRTVPRTADSPPFTLFFAYNQADDMVGALVIRHYLAPSNSLDGGHVAYGVRPSCRRRGYATAMLAQAVPLLRAMGEQAILVTCIADNLGSETVIRRQGGVWESQFLDEHGIPTNRFWIQD